MAIIKPNNNTISAITALPAAISTGKVLQFVNSEEQTAFSTTSSSAVDTGINVSITPTSASSKILLTTNFNMRTAGNTYAAFFVYRQINGGGYSQLDQLEVANHYYLNETISTIFYGKKWTLHITQQIKLIIKYIVMFKEVDQH